MIDPAGLLHGGAIIEVPDWQAVEKSLASSLSSWRGKQGRFIGLKEGEEIAARCMIWLEHSGFPLHDICDGTLLVVMPDSPDGSPGYGA